MKNFSLQSAKLLLLTLGLLSAGAAFAQWQWLDQYGRKIYSDKPPPDSVPESKILHGANGQPYVPAAKAAKEEQAHMVNSPTYGFQSADTPKAKASAPAAASKASSAAGAEKSAKDAAKAKAEQAAKEAEAKRQEQERMAQNCVQLKNNLATIDSGQRLASLDASGNRVVMDDSQRAAERKRTQDLMVENKCN